MENKIESLLNKTFENIKTVIGTESVVGEPIRTDEGVLVIPFSKVSVGFLTAAGEKDVEIGGAGGGVVIAPIGFLVINGEERELIKLDKSTEGGKWTDLVKTAINLAKK